MHNLLRSAGCSLVILISVFYANAQQGKDSLKVMTYNIHHANPPFMIPEINPSKTIDYIAFTRGVFTILKHEVINETYASDHLPVIAILK